MLSKTTTQLLEEVFGFFDERDKKVFGHITTKSRRKAQEDPEALVVSMLLVLKERLPSVSSMLDNIEMALYDSNLKAAKEKLGHEGELLEVK